MARHAFGGDLTAWGFTPNVDDIPVLAGDVDVTFFNQQTGGTQYTDLATDIDGLDPIDHVTTDDGSGPYQLGVIPRFYGPDGVFEMWADGLGANRLLITANDVGT